MSLATRCPACGTTFRVVQDQLKVSEGWVRCGQCQEVFNALESLFELPAVHEPAASDPVPAEQRVAPTDPTDVDLGDEPATPPAPPVAPLPPTQATAERQTDVQAEPPTESGTPPASAAATDGQAGAWVADEDTGIGISCPSQVVQTSAPDTHAAPTAVAAAGPADEAEDGWAGRPSSDPADPADPADLDRSAPVPHGATDAAAPDPVPDAALDAPVEDGASQASTTASVDTDNTDDAPVDWAWQPGEAWGRKRARRRSAAAAEPLPAMDDDATPTVRVRARRRKPEFMRQVERAAHWQRPAVRRVLGSAAAVLLLLLLGQVTLHFRDPWAARWPVLAQLLRPVCQPLGCEPTAPRDIERLVLDSSQLSRTVWPDTLRLTVDLRNTAQHAVRTPALDLSFTDAQGQTLVRKVLMPAELGASAPAHIDAQGLWHIDALLAFGPLRVTGFSAEVFYP